ncbi:hypothetical protein HZH68_011469 [Vespula germanica]|uniref:Protein kinase domain-containing protein n=1 Tax=Vespula germanica TaxID=30212 RepID=A0A834JNT8_VESGE|nr:hypothetical protein HZH68_011469 [Vespula germanica]
MPQGDKRGNEWEFFDATYDGHWDDELRRGLGQLTDGKTGPDDFKMGYYDDRGQGWVGWRNDTRSDQPIEIKFEFDVVREFSAIHIYCNNQFTRDVQIFSQVDILFSIGGRYYNGEPITYTYMEDKIFETSRNVTIKLHHRIGKYVKLRLHFSARWIMISEVIFDSDIAHGNFTTEEAPTTESPIQSDVFVEKNGSGVDGELPVSTAKHDDPTYMAIVIGVLMAVILLLAVAIFLIVSRHRQRKCFASPMTGKAPSHLGSTCATVEKGAALMAYTLEDDERLDFQRDVRILAALEDRNIARVLGACCREEPYCVVMEYLEHGDLCQFLKTHITAEDAHSMPIGVKTLSFNCLIYMAAQIASGMRYLENLNFVHRDLATRNCLVGKAYHIKISDFGTDNELYACDYYKVDGTVPLPVRWMAWESIFLGKYTTKSDVWAFAVTLWEILNLGRRVPYEHLSNEEVVESLRRFHRANEEDGSASESGCTDGTNDHFDYLPRPTASSKDIYDLMLECWRREENERPTFREISLFLQRKNLGYAPTS